MNKPFLKIVSMCFLASMTMACNANADAKPNKITPCPNKPNCVSSKDATTKDSYISPIQLAVDANKAKEALKKVMLAEPKVALVAESGNNLHFTQTSKIFGFIDDVNVEVSANKIDIRSASRTGYSDFGVNRKRIEKIRNALKTLNVTK